MVKKEEYLNVFFTPVLSSLYPIRRWLKGV